LIFTAFSIFSELHNTNMKWPSFRVTVILLLKILLLSYSHIATALYARPDSHMTFGHSTCTACISMTGTSTKTKAVLVAH